MLLSIIIPAYNEEKTVKIVLSNLQKMKLQDGSNKEIIVVNDASIDETGKVLDKIKGIKIINHKKNLGKGEAVKSGFRSAKGDLILIQDADLEYNPEEIPNLLKPLLSKPTTDNRQLTTDLAVYGSRFMNHQAIIPPLYLFGNKFLTIVTNLLYGTRLTDMETGYKLLPASFLKTIKLTNRRFDIEPEITAKQIKRGIKIIEVPISYKGRTHLAGKKLTIKDSFGAISTLLYYRFFSNTQ